MPCAKGQVEMRTDIMGLMLAYRSSFLRRATIGDEYPTTLLEGELYSEI